MPVFKSDTVSISRDIALVYSPQSGNGIITLVDNNPDYIKYKFGLQGTKGVCNALLDELRCYATISSLPEVSFPDYSPEDSESERVIKAQSYEYNTARFEGIIYRKAQHSTEWAEVGLVALKNAGGFRYRIHRLLDLLTDNIGVKLGEYGKIGIAIKSVGYGYPQSFDRISFTGSWVQEYTWASELPPAVIVNNYGSTSNSPTPTPTPVTPTFVLSLAQGKTSAVANTSDQIILTTTGISAGTGLSGIWYKGTTSTGINESISVLSGGIVLLNSNKLLASGAGNYKLKITYSGTEYTTNEVAVSVSPEVTVAITSTASGDTSFFVVGNSFQLAITGKYFTPGTVNFTWYRNNVALTNTGTATADANGNFTLDQSTSNASFYTSGGGSKEGTYKLRFVQGSVTVDSNTIYGADRLPAVSVSPTSASVSTSTNLVAQVRNFTVNDALTSIWLKDGAEIPSTSTQRTYAESSGDPFNGYYFSFSTPANTFSSLGAGTYTLKVTKNNTPLKAVSGSVTLTA